MLIPVNHETEVAFCAVAKNASTSLLTAIAKAQGWGETAYDCQRHQVDRLPDDWTIWAIVRHPIDRLVSAWLDRVYEPRDGGFTIRDLCTQGLDVRRGMGLAELAAELRGASEPINNVHFRPQRLILQYHPGLRWVHFERLADGPRRQRRLNVMIDHLNLGKIEHLNETAGKRPWQTYLAPHQCTKAERALIFKLCRADAERFGYAYQGWDA